MTYIIGIDDAGRGPVIGPMVLAGIIIKDNEETELKKIGAKDSKLLSPHRIKVIYENIINKYKYHIEIISPKEIDSSKNLNTLEATISAKIINKLSAGLDGDIIVIIDCPSTNIKNWNSLVESFVTNKKIKIKSEHKADANHLIVSSASIIAKENRESEIKKIKDKYKIEFGSGYPADQVTKEFIINNHNNEKFKDIIRHSWSTVKSISNKTLF